MFETTTMATDFIGWLSTLILCATISRQVYTQWKTRTSAGVSHWLFIGQLAASAGFVVYSFLLDNWVFVFSNVFLLFTAMIGQLIYLKNRKATAQKTPAAQKN
jgi:MtN3 and saliva related transmembrane protein